MYFCDQIAHRTSIPKAAEGEHTRLENDEAVTAAPNFVDHLQASRVLLTRRALLRGLAATIVPDEVMPAPSPGDVGPASITAWVRIGQNNSIALIASQSEMGQGTTTTLAAALADELYL